MTASFGKNTNASIIIEGLPYKVIELMILKFGDNFVGGVGLDFLVVSGACDNFLVGNYFFHEEFLCFYRKRGFWPDLGETGAVPIHSIPLHALDVPWSLPRYILRPLHRDGLRCLEHGSDDVSPHTLGRRDKAHFPLDVGGEQLP